MGHSCPKIGINLKFCYLTVDVKLVVRWTIFRWIRYTVIQAFIFYLAVISLRYYGRPIFGFEQDMNGLYGSISWAIGTQKVSKERNEQGFEISNAGFQRYFRWK